MRGGGDIGEILGKVTSINSLKDGVPSAVSGFLGDNEIGEMENSCSGKDILQGHAAVPPTLYRNTHPPSLVPMAAISGACFEEVYGIVRVFLFSWLHSAFRW